MRIILVPEAAARQCPRGRRTVKDAGSRRLAAPRPHAGTPGPLAATFLDLPAGSPGGSVELFLDLHTGEKPLIPARAFMLAPTGPRPRHPAVLDLLTVAGKCLEGPAFGRYVAALRQALRVAIDPSRIGVLRLHHLAFGATPALIRALPSHPRMALVHGTDLIFSEAHRDKLQGLRETARAADAIVVPTGATADHLPRGYFLDEFEPPPRQNSSFEKAHPR